MTGRLQGFPSGVMDTFLDEIMMAVAQLNILKTIELFTLNR